MHKIVVCALNGYYTHYSVIYLGGREMKMSKRILSAILAVLMIVTMLPSFAVTVFAEEAKYVPVSAAGKEVVEIGRAHV